MFTTIQPMRIVPGADAALLDWFSEAKHCLSRHEAVFSVRLLQPVDGGSDYLLQITWRSLDLSQRALADPEYVESLARFRAISAEKRGSREYRLIT